MSPHRPTEEISEETAAPSAPGVRPWLRLYPFEIVAWLALISGVAFLRSQGLAIGWQTFDYTIPPLIPVMGKFFASGILIYLVNTLLRRQSPVAYLRSIFSLRWVALTLRLWVAILLFNYTYFWLKVCVPFVNPRLWDEALWNLDVALHFGYSPTIVMVNAVRGSLLAWLDAWYGIWITTVGLTIAFFIAHPSDLVRRRFVMSCVLIWGLGAWIYVALPALGPIYAYPQHFNDVIEQMPKAAGGHNVLWDNYQIIQQGIQSGQIYRFNPTRGIAAMPSLHVGVHFLFALWFRRYARPLFIPAAVATFLTLLGSIITGWHYAVDGYIGILLGLVAYLAALRLERPDSSESISSTPTSDEEE